jgi:bacteriocin-type transport-associated protein
MTEVLLRELMTDDLAWLKQVGVQQTETAGKILGVAQDYFYLLLDGEVAVMLSNSELDPLQRAFATIEATDRANTNAVAAMAQQVATLKCGEVFGMLPGLATPLPLGELVAKTSCMVLAVPILELMAKLQGDVGFAGRFYKFLAILWAGRWRSMLRRLERRNLAQGRLLPDVWLVFGEFHDRDVEWLMAMGELQQVGQGDVLVRAGSAIDSLFLLLDGSLLMLWTGKKVNPLERAFATIEGQESIGQEVAQLGQGALFGESPFLDGRLGQVTIQAATTAMVLAVPQQLLLAKLQQDLGFTGRFYRVLCVVMGHRLQGVYGRLGYGRRVYLDGDENELEMETIDRMGLAGRRFELMQTQMMKKKLQYRAN